MSKSPIEVRLAAKKALIPKKGFNLVGVDAYERDPADELFLIGSFDSEKDAKRAQAEYEKKHPAERTFIYSPDTK